MWFPQQFLVCLDFYCVPTSGAGRKVLTPVWRLSVTAGAKATAMIALQRRRASPPVRWVWGIHEATVVHPADGAAKMTKKCQWAGLFRDTSGSKSDTSKMRIQLAFCTVCHAREISQ